MVNYLNYSVYTAIYIFQQIPIILLLARQTYKQR